MNKILKILIILIIILITCSISSKKINSININSSNPNIIFTEIMFNPQGSDTGSEWIEIHTNSCINLTEYKLYEADTNHKITSKTPSEDIVCNYALISNDPEIFLQKYNNIYNLTNENLINKNIVLYRSVFSLNNNGEILGLKKDDQLIEYIDYSLILSEINVTEGNSLENVNNIWTQSLQFGGNPGNWINNLEYTIRDNIDITQNIIINESIEENNTYENITTINEEINNFNNNSGINNTDINNSNNSTYTNYNHTASEIILENNTCYVNISLALKEDKEIFINNEQIKFKNKIIIDSLNNTLNNINISERNRSIEYWIEDIFGNIVKNKVVTNNEDYKSFTPKIIEEDKVLIIKTKLLNFNDCKILEGSDEKIIIIKNYNYTSINSEKETREKLEKIIEELKIKKSSNELSNESITNKETQTIISSNIPYIKIINVCSDYNYLNKTSDNYKIESLENFENNITLFGKTAFSSNDEYKHNLKIDKADSTKNINLNTYSNKNNSNMNNNSYNSLISGATIYKSESLNNKIYAVVLLIILIIVGISILIYENVLKKS